MLVLVSILLAVSPGWASSGPEPVLESWLVGMGIDAQIAGDAVTAGDGWCVVDLDLARAQTPDAFTPGRVDGELGRWGLANASRIRIESGDKLRVLVRSRRTQIGLGERVLLDAARTGEREWGIEAMSFEDAISMALAIVGPGLRGGGTEIDESSFRRLSRQTESMRVTILDDGIELSATMNPRVRLGAVVSLLHASIGREHAVSVSDSETCWVFDTSRLCVTQSDGRVSLMLSLGAATRGTRTRSDPSPRP